MELVPTVEAEGHLILPNSSMIDYYNSGSDPEFFEGGGGDK